MCYISFEFIEVCCVILGNWDVTSCVGLCQAVLTIGLCWVKLGCVKLCQIASGCVRWYRVVSGCVILCQIVSDCIRFC